MLITLLMEAGVVRQFYCVRFLVGILTVKDACLQKEIPNENESSTSWMAAVRMFGCMHRFEEGKQFA